PEEYHPQADPLTEITRRELRRVIDDELHRLPEKYRAPLVLCYLEGKTNEEAARELGWPAGSMSPRLERGRALLRLRLLRRRPPPQRQLPAVPRSLPPVSGAGRRAA